MENPSFKEKYFYTKTLFASYFVLAKVVSERVLERQFQGLFKSGPKSCTCNQSKLGPNVSQNTSFSFITKFRGHLRQVQQVKLVNKIDEERPANKIDTYTKGQDFKNKSTYLQALGQTKNSPIQQHSIPALGEISHMKNLVIHTILSMPPEFFFVHHHLMHFETILQIICSAFYWSQIKNKKKEFVLKSRLFLHAQRH